MIVHWILGFREREDWFGSEMWVLFQWEDWSGSEMWEEWEGWSTGIIDVSEPSLHLQTGGGGRLNYSKYDLRIENHTCTNSNVIVQQITYHHQYTDMTRENCQCLEYVELYSYTTFP